MKNNFRYLRGCPSCNFCYRRLGLEVWEFYCQLDGVVIPDMFNALYDENITNEILVETDEIIASHRVYSHSICDDFENKT